MGGLGVSLSRFSKGYATHKAFIKDAVQHMSRLIVNKHFKHETSDENCTNPSEGQDGT